MRWASIVAVIVLAGCGKLAPLDPWDIEVPGQHPFMVYADNDGDGFGTHTDNLLLHSKDPIPAGFSRESSDCDDGDADVFPAQGCECTGVAMSEGTAYDALWEALEFATRYRTVYVCPGVHTVTGEASAVRSMRLVAWNGDADTTVLTIEESAGIRLEGANIEVVDLGFSELSDPLSYTGSGSLLVDRSRFVGGRGLEVGGRGVPPATGGVHVTVRDSVFSDITLSHAIGLATDNGDMLVELEHTEFLRNPGGAIRRESSGLGDTVSSLALELRQVTVSDSGTSRHAAVVIGADSVGTLTLEDSTLIRNKKGAVSAGNGAFVDIVSINTDWGEGADDNGSDLNGIDDLGADETFECRIGTEWDEPCRP